MFDAIRDLMSRLAHDGEAREFDDADHRLAAAALFAHVADADGVTTEAERRRTLSLLSSSFGLDAAAARRLLEAAQRSDREAVDFVGFVDVLKRAFDAAGRLRIVEMMWEIAYADGLLNESEGDIVARLAELLGASEDEVADLRGRVAARAARG